MKNVRKKIILMLLLIFSIGGAKAQFYSLSTNVLADATANINAEFSFTLNRKVSLHIPFQYNPFVFEKNGIKRQWRNFTFTPSVRYWIRESYTGWFGAFEGVYSHYSIGGIWDDYRYAGDAYGAGLSFGRAYAISKKWNWEWEIGAGMIYTGFGKYICTHCGWKIKDDHKVYLAPTKAAVRLIYLF